MGAGYWEWANTKAVCREGSKGETRGVLTASADTFQVLMSLTLSPLFGKKNITQSHQQKKESSAPPAGVTGYRGNRWLLLPSDWHLGETYITWGIGKGLLKDTCPTAQKIYFSNDWSQISALSKGSWVQSCHTYGVSASKVTSQQHSKTHCSDTTYQLEAKQEKRLFEGTGFKAPASIWWFLIHSAG